MSTLFTVSQSWFNRAALYEQCAFASRGDAILLMQDAVLALQSPVALASFVAKCDRGGIAVYALQEDCRLRGIESRSSQIEQISYAGFVDLVVKYEKQLAW